MFSATKLSRPETGRVGASKRDIRDLCIVYGLMALSSEAKQRAWWQPYDLPYATYVAWRPRRPRSGTTNRISCRACFRLRTTRAIFESGDPSLDPVTVEQNVKARLRRQGLLARDDSPSFHCILDEAALRRPVGGPAVMRAQLGRIIEVAGLPRVTFQLIPFALALIRDWTVIS